jgi:hypothetical protein
MDLGPKDVVLGIEWLQKMNPCVDWKKGTVGIPEPQVEEFNLNQATRHHYTQKGILEENTDELWVSAGYTYLQQIAEVARS